MSKRRSVAGSATYLGPSRVQLAQSMQQLLDGVRFMHENCVAHRDIKAANAP